MESDYLMPKGRSRYNMEHKGKMKIISVNIPVKFYNMFNKLEELGLVNSRSEAVRLCIYFGMPFMFSCYRRSIKVTNAAKIRNGLCTDAKVIFVPNGDGTYAKYNKTGEA